MRSRRTVVALAVAVLLTAALTKAFDWRAALVGLGTFGLHGTAAQTAWFGLVVVEAVIAIAVLAGSDPAAVAGAALLGGFALAQAIARGGAPCGCLGTRGRLTWLGVAGTVCLAALFLLA